MRHYSDTGQRLLYIRRCLKSKERKRDQKVALPKKKYTYEGLKFKPLTKRIEENNRVLQNNAAQCKSNTPQHNVTQRKITKRNRALGHSTLSDAS